MKAMIFAAGLGKRLRPITNKKPKALVEIDGTSLLEITIKKLIQFGFDEIVINVYHFAEQIISFIKKTKFDADIHISEEWEALLDTGGGLKHAQWFFNDNKPFLAHNVDIITDLDLGEFYNAHLANDAIATLAVRNRESSRYFVFDEENNLCGWRNAKTGEEKIYKEAGVKNELAFSGIHVIDPKIFKYFPWREVFSIVDLYLSAVKSEKIKAYPHNDTMWKDVGRIEDLKQI